MKHLIGNDIVDLTTSDALFKSQNKRFVNRVLHKSEVSDLLNQNNVKDQDLYLWSCWAAKEAVYKVIKKLKPEVIFSHSNFVVCTINLDELIDKKTIKGFLNYDEKLYPVIWELGSDFIHCVAFNHDNDKSYMSWKVKRSCDLLSNFKFSTKEALSIHSVESKLVRFLAKDMLINNGIKNAEVIRDPIENDRYCPPYISQNNKVLKNMDITMSHDGQFVSCGIIERPHHQH